MIRVVVVDDHPVVRAGLAHLLTAHADIEVVGVAAGGDEAVGVVRSTSPDVVLMDVSMPGTDGIAATKRVLAEVPDTRVVALTSFVDHERVLGMLDAGAVGYLIKDSEPDELVSGIRAAARGQSPLAPTAAQALVRERHEQSRATPLSEREREVLALVASGLANKQIGRRLGITESTVKAHVTRILQAVGASDRTQAAVWAHRHDIV